jgi:hypothetical protein
VLRADGAVLVTNGVQFYKFDEIIKKKVCRMKLQTTLKRA